MEFGRNGSGKLHLIIACLASRRMLRLAQQAFGHDSAAEKILYEIIRIIEEIKSGKCNKGFILIDLTFVK